LSIDLDTSGGEPTISVQARADLGVEETDRLIADLQRLRRQAFGAPEPSAVVIDLVERGRQTTGGTGSLILPSELRINGQPVYTSGPIWVSKLRVGQEMPLVTVTLPVRQLTIAADGDLRCASPLPT
jgi:hypothetical protein